MMTMTSRRVESIGLGAWLGNERGIALAYKRPASAASSASSTESNCKAVPRRNVAFKISLSVSEVSSYTLYIQCISLPSSLLQPTDEATLVHFDKILLADILDFDAACQSHAKSDLIGKQSQTQLYAFLALVSQSPQDWPADPD